MTKIPTWSVKMDWWLKTVSIKRKRNEMSDTTGLNASDAARALTISDIVVTLMSVASNEHCQCLIPEFAIE